MWSYAFLCGPLQSFAVFSRTSDSSANCNGRLRARTVINCRKCPNVSDIGFIFSGCSILWV